MCQNRINILSAGGHDSPYFILPSSLPSSNFCIFSLCGLVTGHMRASVHNIPCYLARTQANERAGYEAG